MNHGLSDSFFSSPGIFYQVLLLVVFIDFNVDLVQHEHVRAIVAELLLFLLLDGHFQLVYCLNILDTDLEVTPAVG